MKPDLKAFEQKAKELHEQEVENITLFDILEDIALNLKGLGLDKGEYHFLMYDINLLKEKYDRQAKGKLPN